MGWKNVKEHYRIEHIVRVEDDCICIGSGYIPNLISIDQDGTILENVDGSNDDLHRYLAEFKADPEKLKELVSLPDKFGPTVPVYTYDGDQIIEKQCEETGWPNLTTDGELMYENTFFASRDDAIETAITNAKAGISLAERALERLRADRAKEEAHLEQCSSDLESLLRQKRIR